MEEITLLTREELQRKLDMTVSQLTEYGSEIRSLNEENERLLRQLEEMRDKLKGRDELIEHYREEIDSITHEDEVVITTKHKISNIDIFFEEGGKS